MLSGNPGIVGATYAALGNAAQGPAPVDERCLSAILHQIDERLATARALRERLEGVANTMRGDFPVSGGVAGDASAPQGALGMVERGLLELGVVFNGIDDALRELERAAK